MRILTGTVVAGKVEVDEGGSLPDGRQVVVLSADGDDSDAEPVRLSEQDSAELRAACEELDAGKSVGWEELLAELQGRR